MLQLPFKIGFEPVIRFVALNETLNLGRRPAIQRLAQPRLRRIDPRLPRLARVAPGKQRLGVIIKRAQELAFPAVPDARPHRADIGDSEQEQELQPFGTLHNVREGPHGLRVRNIAALRGLAHGQMVLDEPAAVSASAGSSPMRKASLRVRSAPTIL